MRNGFTLIELLVVLTIVTLVMGVVVPKGVKLMSSYEHSLDRMEDLRNISEQRAKAFLLAKEISLNIGNKQYLFTRKGEIIEISNDNN